LNPREIQLEIPNSRLLELKRKELELLRERKKGEETLPHIFVPMYPWQRKLHESENRVNLLTAANQIGKSSALIRRMIANCTDRTRWERLWGPNAKPNQFWYFYPDSMTLDREIDTKWVPEWLPRGRMQNDVQYGWRLRKKSSQYFALDFNAGPSIFFQTYSKRVQNIQAGSIHEVACDEEMPMEFYDEIMFRLTATAGIFSSGFTPTLNQLFWKQAMEQNKILPSALKLCVSMYDCLRYEDGTPSRIMTLDKIKLAEEKCKNETERQRRIFGKFVTEEGRTYYAFDFDEHMAKPHPFSGWFIYSAVDYGSGSDESKYKKKNHPAGIVLIAVSPDYKKGVVFKSWRGDGEKTTAGDVFIKYQEMVSGLTVTQACYDPSSADFGTIASRNSVTFQKANKARDAGEDMVNTLFKHKMLTVFDDDPENMKLAGELMTIMQTGHTRGDAKTGDDLADALRYACMLIPWDLSVIDESVAKSKETATMLKTRPLTDQEYQALQIRMRRGEDVSKDFGGDLLDGGLIEDEFDYWNEEYGA
jgi:phage terminase large subunit-like protein